MSRYIMSLDAGTTSVRAIIFDEEGKPVGQASRPIKNFYPHPGWVEQDPEEIASGIVACMVEVQFKTGIHSDRLAAVSIANQRETTVVWDKETGHPIYNAIVWQCRRTAPQIQKLLDEGAGELIHKKCGLIPDPYFSGTKIAWILDHVERARADAEAGKLLAGTIDTWLVWNLTAHKVHATDYTNASRTMLFDITKLCWDKELCDLVGVPMNLLPEAKPSDGDFGYVTHNILSHRPPITGVVGDQQAALFGHCCFASGSAKNTYGTGCFLLANVGAEPKLSDHGLVTTIGIAQGSEIAYALEGSVFNAGTVIQWLRDDVGLISSAQETADIALSIPDTQGCYLVPAFTGLGAPWWDADARGLLCGLTRGTKRAHIVRAACESLAYQTYDIAEAMFGNTSSSLSSLEVDGGASRNDFIMQFQADLLQANVVRCAVGETTALGAAYIAGLATGVWGSRKELCQLRSIERTFVPEMQEEERTRLIAGWRRAVERALS
ncbi:MAG: glycerol kinase [Coriobacteriaceae bacterium]|jgi:glycerol kinase|uniref:glycerol kinase GlpK n=1 Tax=Olsenella TaxID=133925 RepID=UPI000FF7FD61|nr:glycerol kinase GlpK [Atopobium sp.]MDD6705099.1 glycerol kinase GlpK [Olsenella sp.]MDY4651331.1 glycerol kinase GlpK [Atopobiaceae bacterium]RRF92644.1 MAG: glycerol kinase [Coriobacteriaceae bacterium]